MSGGTIISADLPLLVPYILVLHLRDFCSPATRKSGLNGTFFRKPSGFLKNKKEPKTSGMFSPLKLLEEIGEKTAALGIAEKRHLQLPTRTNSASHRMSPRRLWLGRYIYSHMIGESCCHPHVPLVGQVHLIRRHDFLGFSHQQKTYGHPVDIPNLFPAK